MKNFLKINEKFEFFLKNDEIERLFFVFYEVNCLNIRDFLLALFDQIPKEREKTIGNLWKSVSNNKDEIESEDLFDMYCLDSSQEQAEEGKESQSFESKMLLINNAFSYIKSAYISKEIFTIYYKILSFFILSNEEFDNILKSSFSSVGTSKNKENPKENKGKDVDKVELNIDQQHMKTLSILKTKLLKLDRLIFVRLNNYFSSVDHNKNFKIDFDLFEKSLKRTNTAILKNEISYLYGLFEDSTTGNIDYQVFLRTILNVNYRISVLKDLYSKLINESPKGKLTISYILKKYNPTNHPEVQNGNEDASDLYKDMENALKINYDQENQEKEVEFCISKSSFIDFYLSFTAEIRNDDVFEIMINNCWGLSEEIYEFTQNEGVDSKKTSLKKRKLEEEYEERHHKNGKVPFGIEKKYDIGEMNPLKKTKRISYIMKKFIGLVTKRGTRGIFSIKRTFHMGDVNENGVIDSKEFTNLLKNVLRFDISSEESTQLFNEFDRNKDKEISYEEFIDSILGEMSDERITKLKQVFYILDKDNSGLVSVDEVKDGFNYKRHPDVLKGKRSPEDVFSEFLDNLDYFFNLLTQKKGNSFGFEDFLDFYRNISVCFVSDKDFSVYLHSVWGLEN